MSNLPLKTKEEAWGPQEGVVEQNIPIKNDGRFHFTRRWFKQRNQGTFSTFLPKKYKGDKPINMIQIGVFEGMDLVWQMQNTCKHPDSRVLAIDPWMKTTKLSQDDMNTIAGQAQKNLSYWKDQIKIERNLSDNVLERITNLPVLIGGKEIKAGEWDLIIVDGDHTADAVFKDAVLSLGLLKPKGWMVFDDVRNRIPKPHEVPAGLTRFLEKYDNQVKRVWYHHYCECFEKLK